MLPFDIQSEIINRLPVRAVLRGRSVSKLWKSLIDSPKFITSYHTRKPQRHLFVKYEIGNEVKHVLIADDDTFVNQLTSSLTVPQSVRQPGYVLPLYSVNGLLCLYNLRRDAMHWDEKAVLWNPSIRKAVSITISNPLSPPNGFTFIGFGVCPNTSDPKIVRINTIGWATHVMNWEVEVFTLSTRVWKSVSNIPLALKTYCLTFHHVWIDGFIYWLGYDSIKEADGNLSYLIISFDLKSHEFGEVRLPDRIEHTNRLEVSKVYESSLGLFEYYNQLDYYNLASQKHQFCYVWIMKEGVNKSFTKILSIKVPRSWSSYGYRVLELRKNGEAIIENIDNSNLPSVLEVYDTSSGSISSMGINGAAFTFSVYSYMETLLLLDIIH